MLLKNVGNALPLHAPKSLAIIGNGAGPGSKGINGSVNSISAVILPKPHCISSYSDRGGDDGVLAMGKTNQLSQVFDIY